MGKNTTRDRMISLILYSLALLVVQWTVVEPAGVPSTTLGFWLYNGFAALLLGRVLNPHFTPPADAATNAFASAITMIAAYEPVREVYPDNKIILTLGVLCAAVFLGSVLVMLLRPSPGAEPPRLLALIDRLVRGLGSPNVIFTVVILSAVWLFHRNNATQVFAILGVWTVVIAIAPVEGIINYLSFLSDNWLRHTPGSIVGAIAAHQSPGIVLIRQPETAELPIGEPLLINDVSGPRQLAVSVNYVGRDEGNLLRAIALPLPAELGAASEAVAIREKGVAVRLPVDLELLQGLPDGHPASILRRMDKFCGIVDQDTSLEYLQFEVVEERGLAEGCLVETSIAGVAVLYQVIEGITREEIVQQKNKYGYARGKARKIGTWNVANRAFDIAKWLPRINSPVFRKDTDEGAFAVDCIGRFPSTSYSVRINISDTVTHNTAILGVLGIGKSYLAIELVERMIAQEIKVICLDLTNQYAEKLGPFLDAEYELQKTQELKASGGRGQTHQNKEEGGTKKRFKAQVLAQLTEFLRPGSNRFLRIYNPAEFDVWQQTANPYAGNASMASLTACEITSIITEVALEVAQTRGMTDTGRICLVFEEAHSLVPEWNSVAAEGDKAASVATARAILQGRKYGLGCLLITQRTANVTKTILNQCNTIFAMRIFDDTGMTFLSNYIGGDYASVLPSLPPRHAVFFGKASGCPNPVLLQLNDNAEFTQAFRQQHPPPQLPVVGAGVENEAQQ